ncbi:sugar ABC transporter substrate-binding protein [Nostoc sp.]|uniref:sugar ABC transporter substrate-binding protein n=1 Tax=Nostoc sp. TaxID=1180 RepID=UPI002FF72589
MNEAAHQWRLAIAKIVQPYRPSIMQRRHFLKLSGISGLVFCSLSACRPATTKQGASPTPASKIASAPQTQFTQLFSQEIKANRPWNLVVMIKDEQDPYQVQLKRGAEKAAQDFGVNVKVLDNKCNTCIDQEIQAISNVIQQGHLDGLIIVTVDSVKLVRVVEKAIDAGISVIAIDTPINSDRIVSFVDFDNFTASQQLGEWVVQRLKGHGRVLILNGVLEQQNALERRNGFLAGLKQGDMEVLDMQSAHWEQKEAKVITANWLKQFPNVDVIFAACDTMAFGAREAVVEAKEQKIQIVSFDGTRPALEAVQKGAIAATAMQQPLPQARLAVQMMIRHLQNRETFPPIVKIPPPPVITQDNVKEYLARQ